MASIIPFYSIDKYRSLCLLQSHLHSETESTILAIQDQVIATRVIEAKIMNNVYHH